MQEKRKSQCILETAFILMIIILISKLTGFLREYALATAFGATFEADAYTIALNVPNILFATFLIAVTNCFIPQYNSIRVNYGKERSEVFLSNICSLLTFLAFVLVLLIAIFPGAVVHVFASGFKGETYSLTCRLVVISSFMMLVMPISQIYAAYLQSNKKPLIAAANNILYNVLMIIAFAMATYISIIGIAVAGSVFFFTQILIQYPTVNRLGHKPKIILKLDHDIKQLFKLMLPVLISTAVVEINTLVDRSMASGLAEGSVSSLNYAKKLTDLGFGVISVSVSAMIYPKLTKLFADNKTEEFKSLFVDSFQIVCLFTLPILTMIMAFSGEVVSLVYGRGNFDETAMIMTTSALFYYAGGMFFSATRDLLIKAFYAMHNTRTAMFNSIVATVINIVLNIILIQFMAHAGLALASSISFAITTALLTINLGKNITLEKKHLFKDIAIGTILAFAEVLLIRYIYFLISPSGKLLSFIVLAMLVIIYIALYVLTCYIFRIRIIYRYCYPITIGKLKSKRKGNDNEQ